MKKLLALAALSFATACAPTSSSEPNKMAGMSCKCCQGMNGDAMKEGAGCCCKGMMSSMDMKDGKGMMCEKMMQDKAETKKPSVKTTPAPASGHEQHH
jgi:hypothetical protein